jgi:hypothetical protein
MKRLTYFSITIFLFMATAACDSTRIVSSYETDEADEIYSGIYVVGISGNAIPEERMESHLIHELEEEGYVAAADQGTFSPEKEWNEGKHDEIRDTLESKGFDGILTFSLVSLEEEPEFVTGVYPTNYYPPRYDYYAHYWGYYGHYGPTVLAPGYYTTNTVFQMEANLYDVETGELAWAARSETVEPTSVYTFAENFAETVVREMIDSDIIEMR